MIAVFIVTMRIALSPVLDCFLGRRYYANSRRVFQSKSPIWGAKQVQYRQDSMHDYTQEAAGGGQKTT